MSVVPVEISRPPVEAVELTEAIVLDDLEAAAIDAAPGCGNDNPYQ